MATDPQSWPLGHIWKSKADFARAIRTPVPTVTAWFSTGRRIPPARFPQIITAAAALGHELTWQELLAVGDIRPTPSEDAA